MRARMIGASILALSLVAGDTPVYAGGRDVVVGVGVGLGLGLMLNELSKSGPRRSGDKLIGRVGERPRGQRTRSPEQVAAERAERERGLQEAAAVQAALNTLSFDAGAVDGRPGPQTRAAVRRFQASLGAVETGNLTDEQRSQLLLLAQPQMAANAVPASASPVGDPLATSAGLATTAVPPSSASSFDAVPSATGGTFSAQDFQTTLPTPATTLPTPAATLPVVQSTAQPALPSATNDRTVAVSVPNSLDLQQSGQLQSREDQKADVLGIQPGQSSAEALAALVEVAGADACQNKPGAIVCSMEAGGMKDEIVLGKASAHGGDVVYSIIRTMSFPEPVARADIEAKLNASYPLIMANANRNVFSSLDCEQTAQRLQDDNFRGLRQMILAGDAIDSRVAAFGAKCEYYQKIALEGEDKLSQITITLFSGTPVMNSLGSPASASNATPDIRF